MGKQFTGEELAKALQLHLTEEERTKYFLENEKAPRIIDHGLWGTLKRRINPGKIFLVRFVNGHASIVMAEDADDALLEVTTMWIDHMHHCKDPMYDASCKDCEKIFNDMAEKLNQASVLWLGWGQPDYNWVITI